MHQRRIRWGVLGYARIASESVIPALRRAGNAELRAVASRDPARREACRVRYAVPELPDRYEALLADPAIDALYIPLPNSLHQEWTLRALAAGKHVLCEKPLGLTGAEARTMRAAAGRHGVLLMEAFMYRYTERTRRVLEIVRSGQLGEIREVGSTFRFFLDRPTSIKWQPGLGGGSLYDVGCYPVNFIGLVADASAGTGPGTAVPVAATAVAEWSGGVDVAFAGALRYASGLLGVVHSGFNAHRRVHAEIIGTKGVLEIPDPYFDNPGALTLTRGEAREEIPVPASDRYRAEVEDFSAAILEGREPAFSLAESVRNADVLDRLLAAARASRAGEPPAAP